MLSDEYCGVDSSNQIPDRDTIGRFRNIFMQNGSRRSRLCMFSANL